MTKEQTARLKRWKFVSVNNRLEGNAFAAMTGLNSLTWGQLSGRNVPSEQHLFPEHLPRSIGELPRFRVRHGVWAVLVPWD